MFAFKAALLALVLAAGGLLPSGAQAQDSGAEKERILAGLMSEALAPSRLPEIYADIRRSVREVYLPLMREQLENARPGQPAPEPRDADRLAKLATFFDYALRASDELAPVLAASRDEIIGDIARLQAKYLSRAEVDALAELLDMPAMRKLFNTVYAATRLFTNYSYDEVRSYYALSEWMKELNFDIANNPFTNPGAATPSPEAVSKAQGVITDLFRISRLDDMVADVVRFGKEVQASSDIVLEEDREQVRQSVQNLEFFYNLQKSVVLSVGPSILASALAEDQLDKLHLMVLSPVLAKSFGMLHEVVRSATSLNRQDIEALARFKSETEENGLFPERSPEVEAELEAGAKALGEKWRERLMASLTPETRAGLERSIEALEALKDEDEKPGHEHGEEPPVVPGLRQL